MLRRPRRRDWPRSSKNGTTMRIVSAASAFPEHYYSQEMLLAALQDYWGDQIENPQVLRRLHRHVGVDGRFLSLPKEEYLKMKTWGEANHHWIRTAKDLGEKAVRGALADAGLNGHKLGAFFFVSVTGISSPSIDALLIKRVGVCRNIRIVLSREIAHHVRKNLARDLDNFLGERGLPRADIGSWALHTGGPKILEA